MNKFKFAVEIGGSYTKIYVREEGFALCEPTLVSAEPSPQGYKIVGFGQNAKDMMGKTNDSIEVFSPISNGKINNYEYLKTLLEYFFEKVGGCVLTYASAGFILNIWTIIHLFKWNERKPICQSVM